MERTVVLIKPDAVKKGVIGKIITRLENEKFTLIAAKFLRMPEDLLDDWYAHHKDKPFFPELKNFMTSTPVGICISCLPILDIIFIQIGL